ncbi:PLP-dependent aminotransferase family protein [Acinetobacter sp. VNK23]|uniref:aminotransferase-like domain-containing protein n=1 Tax=Acinetobacter thutiue TaxID=2998078 RepID=UPI002574B633|nr:PLP-dependent aminotransferase family protein [Acinetobacter thutiue]MDM1021358.1 PLP-dependent aminotransferase family protein [Acinetobacter thutiue]
MKTTKIDFVIQHINEQIKNRLLMPGSRLPSVRALAGLLNLSISTIVEAYERLAAQGLIEAKTGSGFFVAGPLAPLSISEIHPKIDRNIDPLWISRQALEAKQDVLKPGCGWLPDDWMPHENIRKAIRKISKANNSILTDYSTPFGLPALRELLSRRILAKGIEVVPNQILLTDSGTQAIDLICRYFLKPNDVVLVDDPCYFNFHALLKVHQVQIIGIPYTQTGPDLPAFADAVKNYNPRLYITNSGIHNPTGAVLTASTAYQVLKLVEQSNLIVIEDDIFADLERHTAPRLAALDGLSRVIHIGSFSKTLSGSVRTGYIATKPEWIEDLTDIKIATSFGGNHLSAEILFAALTDSLYRKHLEELKIRLAKAMDSTIKQLEKLGIEIWMKPQAGLFLWCKLPEHLDTARIAQTCLEQGVILAPGNAFSQSQNFKNFIRFNVAQCQDSRIFEVLSHAIQQEIEHSE